MILLLALILSEPIILLSGTRLECKEVERTDEWVIVMLADGFKSPHPEGARRFKIAANKVDWAATQRAIDAQSESQGKPERKAIVFDQQALKKYQEERPPDVVHEQVAAPQPTESTGDEDSDAEEILRAAAEKKQQAIHERQIKDTLERIITNWRHGNYSAMLADVTDSSKVMTQEELEQRMSQKRIRPRATKAVAIQHIRIDSEKLAYVTATIQFELSSSNLIESNERNRTFQTIYEDGAWKFDLLAFAHMN
ncbi:MAG: hypothetical protein KDC35_20685 [Acidobacteria bacterium]|nr:hypothetical protein [Acidobacteriota bacterium]